MSDSVVLKVSYPLEQYINYIQAKRYTSLVFVDEEGKILTCNAAFLQLTGYPLQDLLHRSIAAVFDLNHFSELTNFDGVDEDMIILRKRNGNAVKAICHMFRVELEDGKTYYLISVNDFNTNLSLLQEFAGSFLKDVNLGVILIDMDYRVIDISSKACRIIGVKRESVINNTLDEIFASVPEESRLVQRTLLDGMVVRNHAMSWTNNQQRYELLMDSNLLRDGTGKKVGAYVIFKDVSNLRSLEEQVQRSDRLAMIGQIAAGTAHEIRNPLTSIKGFLQVMKKTLKEKGMNREHHFTEIMLSESDRINGLVSEFLLLSKPKDNFYQRVSISKVIKEILPIIKNEALLHNVTVHYESAKLPQVLADKELLKQVCLNICKNGIEAMTDGGILTITERYSRKNREVRVEIHDTGPGIPSFLIDKIFDPFFTTKEEGTGLGLSVCQRIIHDMNGSIKVSSKGYGTTFIVSIPVPD